MRYAIALFALVFCGIAGENTLQSVLESHPENLIQDERLSQNDEAHFTNWKREQVGKTVTVVIRWDGGHKGGYCSIKVGKKTFPVHVSFEYAGQLPKKPKYQVKLRETKCRKTEKRHVKVTRTGKEITVTGEIVSISEPFKICKCKTPELFKVTIKAGSVK